MRAFLLMTIALLPVQMRAGASEAHPHSILQLVLDARDGALDHHGVAGATTHVHEARPTAQGECVVGPDVPSVEETGRLGGISMLTIPALLIFVPVIGTEGPWQTPQPWRGRQPALDPPPPRVRRA